MSGGTYKSRRTAYITRFTHTMRLSRIFPLGYWLGCVVAAPTVFPSSGNGLWYNYTGDVWSKTWLPVGNGYLAGGNIHRLTTSFR
jgi:hypothetical protein